MIKLHCYTQWFLLCFFLRALGGSSLQLAAAGQGLMRNFRFRHNNPMSACEVTERHSLLPVKSFTLVCGLKNQNVQNAEL